MAETFPATFIVPGTYVEVRAEGLIRAGGVSTGNIAIVGTASQGFNETHLLSSFDEALAAFGAYDAYDDGAGTRNLTRSLELLYRNGARTVFARALDPAGNPGQGDYEAAFAQLLLDDVQIALAPELATNVALAVLNPLTTNAESNGKDVIAVVGADATTPANVIAQAINSGTGRIILSTPGLRAFDTAEGDVVSLNGRYSAAAVGGLLASLPVQSSPTNKVLPGVSGLERRYSYGETVQLLQNRLCVLEDRQGVRVVRGLTTNDGAFAQITTRRITDLAKAGIRKASDPFIGRLNNARVRGALRASIDGFLTTMVQNEALIQYELEVTATRDDEIAGRCNVNALLRPTFSIDFIAVTLVLE